MKNSLRISSTYALIVIFVAGWWLLAFKQPPDSSYSSSLSDDSANTEITLFYPHFAIASMDRISLQKALAGDYDLMAKFIADWDIDAQLMLSSGIDGVKRLRSSDFLRSQLLIRQIHDPHPTKLPKHENSITDAAGNDVPLNKDYHRFLPQTYAAASILLALASPEEIVALPRRLREQDQLYPKSLTELIPLDIDRQNGEKLFRAKPDIAFVAHYSHPATVQALKNQGVVLYTMKNLTTLQDIADELINIGTIINRNEQAEMLKIFIDAAMLALDNKQRLLIRHFEQKKAPFPKVLVLNYHQNFSAPTKKSLTGQILTRLNHFDITTTRAVKSESTTDWMVPVDKERLINLDPDCIIIATDNPAALINEIRIDPAMQQLQSVNKGQLYFVDEAIHHSPTQYVVLAYFDLMRILERLQ